MQKERRKKKKVKIKYGRLIPALIILFLVLYLLSRIFTFPIRNIFISGNSILTDQELIDMAGLQDYPSIFSMTSYRIERKLEKNQYIKNATVSKKKLKEIYIEIEENYVLFYNSSSNETILKDTTSVKEELPGPVLINYIPDNLYSDFITKMTKLDRSIINRISEIKYDPNSVDDERFLLTMNDGNYVYLTLMHFNKVNNYVDIIKNFTNQKGILYLDSGEYFQVYE